MQLGDYQIGRKLGEGDMGTVYLSQHVPSGNTVALKVLHKIDMSSSMDRGAAAEVVEFAASIKHQALHPIIDVVNTDAHSGVLAVIMPTASASIGDFLMQGKVIPPKHQMAIINRVVEGLQFLHSQQVAHGSFKPTNVLIDRSGNAFITDLAMAHLRDLGLVPAQPTPLQEHYIFHDRLYNSTPELAADLYALVTFIYQLMTGRLPFSDPRSEVRKVERPSHEGLPPLIYSVLLRGLTHRKRLMYPDIQAFMTDFNGALRGKIDTETTYWFSVDVPPPPDDDED